MTNSSHTHGIASSPPPLTRAQALAWITAGDVAQAADALTRLALYDQDRQWVEGLCCGFAFHPSPAMRRAVLFCFQNYIWGHHTLSVDRVLPILIILASDSDQAVAAMAQEAIEDCNRLVLQCRND